ncbi:hypothetical protein ZOSMA_70G00840 [Zostera marina]|uniref:UspA domain-containing protein n=1 Tax=Zostera marina TaxID=29655 RepID=A0A0K9NSW5_ZOSMR|nr:hypothetical protein ZOSMA_70G00840 [Zostera marina]
MAVAWYLFPTPLSGISKRFASENLLRASHPTCFHSHEAFRKVQPLSCSSFSIRGRKSKFPCSSTVVFGARSELNGSEEKFEALDFFTNVKHVLFPITDQNPYLSEGTKQAAVTTTTLAKKYGADITVVVIDEKPEESIPEHDARLTSIRWHLSEGGFKEFGLIERLGEGKKPTVIIGEVADELNLDLVVLSMESIHSHHVDGNLLAEFIPCPVLLLPL